MSLRIGLSLTAMLVGAPSLASYAAAAGVDAGGLDWLMIGLISALLAAIVLGAAWLWRCLREFTAVVSRWSQDDWSARLDLHGARHPFAPLAGRLNRLAEKIQEEQRQLEHSVETAETYGRRAALAETQLIEAIEAIPEGIALYDADDKFMLCNTRYREIYSESAHMLRRGATFEQIIREGAERGQFVIGSEGIDGWMKQRLDLRAQPNAVSEQQFATGEWFRAMDRRTSDGGIISVRVDITELKRREATFRLLFESNPLPMMVYDFKTLRYLEVNDAAVNHYGYSREQFLAMTVEDIRPPEDVAELRLQIGNPTRQVRRAGTWRHRKADGSIILVNVTSYQLTFHGHNAALAAIVDVTEQERSAAALRESEMRLRQSQQHLAWAQGVAEIGSFEGNLVRGEMVCSDNLYKIFGVDKDFVITMENALTLIHPDDRERYKAAFANWEAGQPPTRRLEFRIIRPDGECRHLLRESEYICDETGAAIGLRGTVFDLTRAKQAEERRHDLEVQLQHSQRVEALGTLAGGVAHDLNNTMVPIVALSKLLSKKFPEGSRERANLETIHASGTRARDLVQQILAFSRKEKPTKQFVDLAAFIDETLPMIRATVPTTIGIDCTVEDDLPPIMADPGQLHQIVINLVNNAAQAIGKETGKITIDVAAADKTRSADLQTLPAGPALRLTIGDTGHGIDKATMARIFEPFFTTKPVGEGTGLGLSVVHGIVATHGGTIQVSSEVSVGTQFHVYFPALDASSADPPAEAIAV